tara:strand:- start:431 stop:1153 length:723 start_codon:yes stop_codon:yes gene_type:complete
MYLFIKKIIKLIFPEFIYNFIGKKISNSIFFHYVRYQGLLNIDYKIDDNICFGKIENDFFLEKIKNSKLYLEYGSGYSTFLANKLNKKFFSIESDKDFYRYIKKKISNPNILLYEFGLVGFYSRPLRVIKEKSVINDYCVKILEYFEDNKMIPDLILVDGRFRVLNILHLYRFFYNKEKKPFIIIDDYASSHGSGRDYLHVVENFFFIKKVGRFGVIEDIKKENFNSLEKYIEDHQFDSR